MLYTRKFRKSIKSWIEKLIKNVTIDNIKKHNPIWSQILDSWYRALINSGSRFGRKPSYLIWWNNKEMIFVIIIIKFIYIYIYVKSPNKAKNNVLLNNMKKFVLKSVKIQKLLINIHITCRNIILT